MPWRIHRTLGGYTTLSTLKPGDLWHCDTGTIFMLIGPNPGGRLSFGGINTHPDHPRLVPPLPSIAHRGSLGPGFDVIPVLAFWEP